MNKDHAMVFSVIQLGFGFWYFCSGYMGLQGMRAQDEQLKKLQQEKKKSNDKKRV